MGGHLRAASVHRRDHLPHLVGGPRRGQRVGTIQVQLHEVGAVVQLAERGREQFARVARTRPAV
jgi:hypothetical protein